METTELKKGAKVELDGRPFVIIKSDFTNPGKGSAFVKVKLRNLETGAVIDRTYKSGVSTGLARPDLEERKVEYMYSDQDGFNFMDQKTFETIHIDHKRIGDDKNWLQEGIKLKILCFKDNPISVELPNFVELKIIQTDPELRGDTVQGGSKKAVLETGAQVSVPLFLKEGEVIKVDTRSGSYIERVNK